MKAFLVALLAAAVCAERGHSLICYTCQGETSNEDYMKISMCAKEDKYCVTIKNVAGAGHESKYSISKMCSPECPKPNIKQGKAAAKVFCCDKLLCNVNGASSRKISYSMISVGILANFIYAFRSEL